MKFLIVDDEHSFGALLGRAIKKLGHKAVVVSHPEDALEQFAPGAFDAVITDIDMPAMHGVELARRMRRADADMPIAFCTGSAPDDALVKQAETIGRVLPKVWTVADIRALIDELASYRSRIARGSQTSLDRLPPMPPGAQPAHVSDDNATRRRTPRKIKVTCRDWAQVAKLCDGHSDGRHHLTLRGDHRLRSGEKLFVALSLPDELVLSIAAEVSTIAEDPLDGEPVSTIDMVGFTPEICSRLLSMAQSAGVLLGRPYQQQRTRNPRGSSPEPTDDGAVLGNVSLRKQIDELGKKLKN